MLAVGCASGPSVAPSSGAASASDAGSGPGTTVPAPGTPAEVLESDDWVLPGRDYRNSRSTFDSTIDSTTVGSLTIAWEAEVAGSLTTVPLIIDDTVYVQDGRGTVLALDRADGTARWTSEPSGFNIGPFGVAVADGRVFALTGLHGRRRPRRRTGTRGVAPRRHRHTHDRHRHPADGGRRARAREHRAGEHRWHLHPR